MKILSIFITLLFCLNISAQTDRRVKYGIKGGLNFDSFTARDAEVGNEIGGSSAMSYYSFIAEVKSSELDFININATYAITSNLNLIQVPIHYRRLIYKTWSVFIGPQLDFIVNDNLVEIDEDILLKKYGFSIAAGIQKNFSNNWIFEIRYSRGLTNILENLGNNLNNLKINEFRLGLGYIF